MVIFCGLFSVLLLPTYAKLKYTIEAIFSINRIIFFKEHKLFSPTDMASSCVSDLHSFKTHCCRDLSSEQI